MFCLTAIGCALRMANSLEPAALFRACRPRLVVGASAAPGRPRSAAARRLTL